ncbi:MAG TPA: BlaI/MecI/CopY family transcriptional regulator [Gemmatimonadales bacterium]|jgi:predicted transcriptional regulator
MSAALTRRELDVMAVVWELGSATVSDVVDRLPDDLHYSTVLTVFRTLEAKGHVRHVRDGKAFRYHPVTRPEDAGDRALRRLVDTVFRGSREMLVARLVSDEGIAPEELRRIRRRLTARLKELGR